MIIKFLLALLFCSLTNPVWAAYSYRRTITVDNTKVPSNQTQFPILVCANGASPCGATVSGLNQTGGGAHVQNSNGYDVIFTTDTTCTTKLTWEMEKYSASTGEFEAWVTNTSVALSSSVPTVFYMCYGNSAISTFQSTASSVWDSNFKRVWHLPDGTTLSVNDSTSNAGNLTNNGTWGAAAAEIDGGTAKSNGTNQSLSDSTLASPTSITISYWQKYLTTDVGNNGAPLSFNFGNTISASPRLLAHSPYSDSTLYWDYANASTGRVTVSYTPYLDAWALVTLVYNNANGLHAIYINGSSVASATQIIANPSLTGITINAIAANGAYDKRQIDEVRVSDSARPADWITTEYNNQNNPNNGSGQFYSMGSEANIGTHANLIQGVSLIRGVSILN